jgi:SAM-dependent methyltransferase
LPAGQLVKAALGTRGLRGKAQQKAKERYPHERILSPHDLPDRLQHGFFIMKAQFRMSEAVPPCPITGEPASRRVQTVGVKLLNGLWKVMFRVSTAELLGHQGRLGLWESPCGLAFFAPMIAGDEAFYARFYGRLNMHSVLAAPGVDRPEFTHAASLVPPGALVLDIGGGEGGFSRHVPHARYVGIDPNAQPNADARIDLRRESLAEHAAAHPGAYDVVCAFQVIEHVTDPRGFAADMATCLRSGGRLIIGVPRWPSPMTDIPNFVFNAPPHHLSWWTEGALLALSARLGLQVETVTSVAVGSHDSVLYWMARLSPKLTGQRFFRANWRWYLALSWSSLAGRVADRLLRTPANATPMILVLSARKPGGS